MRFGDLKIGTQLAIVLAIIFALVLLLSVIVILQEESLWQETSGLYEHPLQVRRAVGDLEADILKMHRGMKELFLTDSEPEREQTIIEIETSQVNASRQFDLLYGRYLGPKSDLDVAYSDFVKWNSIRGETIRLMHEGKFAEALNRTKKSGVGGKQADILIGDLQTISDFSIARGDQFYQSAQRNKEDLNVQLVILLAAILLLLLVISYFLLKGIRDPIRDLTEVTEQYRLGNLDARSQISSPNELGTLARSFNNLVDTVQSELQDKEKAAGIARVMLREEELQSFCRELLIVLRQHTNSEVGAVYILNPQKTDFTLFDSIGLSRNARSSFSAKVHEGEFGAVLATRQIQHIKDIPDDTGFLLSTVSGDIRPREILTIPVLYGTDVVAIISLASVRAYSTQALRLVNDIWNILTARFNGVLAFQKIQEFLETLEHQNQELSEKSRELAHQADELREQNIELELQKKELKEANLLKTVFLSNMSHELRTPLNSVIALSGVLNRRLEGKIPLEEYSYLDIIQRNGRHLLSIINDILDIARIESGREDISLRTFSVHELASTVLSTVGPQAHEKGIPLINHVSLNLPLLKSDFAKCQHILENLVSNAVKFTQEGQVVIRAAVVAGEMQISVIDTGIGIPEDQLAIIFDEFRQVDESIARKYGGTGLGLAIAQKYANLLSGSVDVESTLNKGSTFTIRLPLTLSLTMQETGTTVIDNDDLNFNQEQMSLQFSSIGKTLLIVEDSEPAIIQINDLLKDEGYKLLVARNGKEALEIISKDKPDAVILDLMMPELDGFTVLKMIRSSEQTSQLPVLILTAKHITKEELKFLKGNHIHQLIQKGDINRTGLIAAVRRMISGANIKINIDPGESPDPQARKRPVILVVEDNPDNMMTTQAMLSERYTLIGAKDGLSGLKLAQKERPDLILLDISLPVMDGFAVIAAIREDGTLRNIPVIALTARAMKGDREEILSRGFDVYLSKPVESELLEETIRRALYGS